MKLFWRDESGYVLVLSLIALPALLALGLIIVDVGRGNNAHSDLQAAADAVALAGARELDGGVDAITRAEGAMAELFNTVSFLGLSEDTFNIGMTTDTGEFTITFLTDIPDSDDTPITATYLADNATTNGADAEFIHVSVRSQDLNAFFFNPVTRLRPSVPIAAEAVATYRTAACDVTPLFICNPFETSTVAPNLQTAFSEGRLYGRMLRLLPSADSTSSPGNFGFLSVAGVDDNANNNNTNASTNTLREIFAGGRNPNCYEARTVETKPGRALAIRDGVNVRFDIYGGYFNASRRADYPAPANVRKGYITTDNGGGNGNGGNSGGNGGNSGGNGGNAGCTSSEPVEDVMKAEYNGVLPSVDKYWAIGFTPNFDMTPPGAGGVLGAAIGSGNWDIENYWAVNHPTIPLTDTMKTELITSGGMKSMNADPLGPGSTVPSRYDVYRYEIEKGLVAGISQGDGIPPSDGTTETGLAICSEAPPVESPTRRDPDLRTVFAALVNCIENEGEGGGINTYPVEAYASLFLVRPMDPTGPANLDVEIVDITGSGGNGTLDTFVRDEAILVR